MTEAWDPAAWDRLAAELAGWEPGAATVWWRDDDAGGAGPAFDRLLALAAAQAVPLALAVVPAWLEAPVAAQIRAAGAGVHVLQHGWAHRNHEPPAPDGTRGKPAELGAARPPDAAVTELAAGWRRLGAFVPGRLRPALVPPWNRIAPAVREALPRAGYRTLSTFGARPTAGTADGLRELNTHVDPIRWRSGKGFGGAAWTLDQLTAHLAARRRGQVDATEPTGLLTHHRELTPAAWACLAELLGRLRVHPAVQFPALESLLAGEAG
jgi:peptidoglycan/xylan/chitin deacetylase (PgdA/CDA1 family)